jgi:hypothetical protein
MELTRRNDARSQKGIQKKQEGNSLFTRRTFGKQYSHSLPKHLVWHLEIAATIRNALKFPTESWSVSVYFTFHAMLA